MPLFGHWIEPSPAQHALYQWLQQYRPSDHPVERQQPAAPVNWPDNPVVQLLWRGTVVLVALSSRPEPAGADSYHVHRGEVEIGDPAMLDKLQAMIDRPVSAYEQLVAAARHDATANNLLAEWR